VERIVYVLRVGGECNNNCGVCRFLEKNTIAKSLENIERELLTINKELYSKVLISGGEILLNKDLFDILRLIRAYKFTPIIETNGRTLTEKLIEKLKINEYYISFFSHQEIIHNLITGQKDSFKETIRGINNVIRAGLNLTVKLIITKENYKTLKEIVKLLHSLGVTRIQLVFPESIPEEYKALEELVPTIPEAFSYINQALATIETLKIKLIERETPFSKMGYKSQWVKKGEGSQFGHKLLYDNRQVLDKPVVSVVIPTFNRSRILANTLSSLFNQTFNRFEVIVVDDGSTDNTLEMVKHLDAPFRLRYILQDDLGYGPGRARNIGTIFAEGEIIIYLDSDVICDPNNIEEHMKSHAKYKQKFNHDILVIGKRFDMHTSEEINKKLNPDNIKNNFDVIRKIPARPDIREDFFKWCEDEPSQFHAPWHMIYTNNISIRRKHMLDAGLLDESFVFWSIEDQELGYRLQWLRFVLNSNAVGYHQHHPVVYASKEGQDQGFKYNARIFYKKFLNPKIYEVYKPWLYNTECTVQLNDGTINDSVFFKFIGRKPGKQKSFEEAANEIDLYFKEGNKKISFIGGNPLLYPNFFEIIASAKKFKEIVVDTEGESLESLKTCIDLVGAGVTGIKLTIAGNKAEDHDVLMNKKGSYERVLRAIKNCLLVNVDLTVRIIISRLNYPHLEEIIIALEKMGVKKIKLTLPLSYDKNEYLFDEGSISISSLLYYHIFRSLQTAKKLKLQISTVNVFSEFLGLNINVILRMYDLFGKPIAVSRGKLR